MKLLLLVFSKWLASNHPKMMNCACFTQNHPKKVGIPIFQRFDPKLMTFYPHTFRSNFLLICLKIEDYNLDRMIFVFFNLKIFIAGLES